MSALPAANAKRLELGEDRLTVAAGDVFVGPLPAADVNLLWRLP